ncbi:phage tail protein [Parerythrobacter jejuensis]|uniref:Tip attachment protein J domain-containing protein n=1 Tax=Parerythrobacter jejuensis TaxID=795812 RepID=A0A845AW67_9SPHN|nr:phage tail protein [Parerythrobacter jejuensis]MXP30767.1 hypothetical protein [Parerythrobacter jejuensis]MXP33527.1 hypothetical protein [Parerythrobacter jejuensis]
MATLVLSAVGSIVGGPLGGSIGALIGREVDGRIIGGKTNEGPRLKELHVTTSSYGQPIPRLHGKMRASGSIIWATDLNETSETSGGKGKPKTTTYSYSASFAIALSSRPIRGLGRIWADGNLLRGEAGDLKTGGALRFYEGRGDQPVDPIIGATEGSNCPAFRNCAYAVFEDLDLSDFGNRIPALTFEVIGDDGGAKFTDLVEHQITSHSNTATTEGLQGFAIEAGPVAANLDAIGSVFPLSCEAGEHGLTFRDPEKDVTPVILPHAITTPTSGESDAPSGRQGIRQAAENGPTALRHYDPERDYQPGIQRAAGPTGSRGQQFLEFPGVLSADTAKALAEQVTLRDRWRRERMSWRVAELDPAIQPGGIVKLPDRPGEWLVESWEWRDKGIELELVRRSATNVRGGGTDAGAYLAPIDALPFPTILDVFELPWDGTGSSNQRQIFAAASTPLGRASVSLHAEIGNALELLTTNPRTNSLQGSLRSPLAGSPALRVEPLQSIEVSIENHDADLTDATLEELLNGANRALVGSEVMQFATATPLGDGNWRLSCLLRGRGGTEAESQKGHNADAPFVILDRNLIELGAVSTQALSGDRMAAIGPGDEDPAYAPLRNRGASIRPLTPVHPRARIENDGSLKLCWTRRARGAWAWHDGVEVPLVEEIESYLVGIGSTDSPSSSWITPINALSFDPAGWNDIQLAAPGAVMWVRQIGSFAHSEPLLLMQIP